MLSARIVVDPLVWEIPLGIIGLVSALVLIYYIWIYIAYRMAKTRHRDPLGWVLLSLFVSPILTWIILLIVGNSSSQN